MLPVNNIGKIETCLNLIAFEDIVFLGLPIAGFNKLHLPSFDTASILIWRAFIKLLTTPPDTKAISKQQAGVQPQSCAPTTRFFLFLLAKLCNKRVNSPLYEKYFKRAPTFFAVSTSVELDAFANYLVINIQAANTYIPRIFASVVHVQLDLSLIKITTFAIIFAILHANIASRFRSQQAAASLSFYPPIHRYPNAPCRCSCYV